MGNEPALLPAISERIWDLKYRFKEPDGRPIDRTLNETVWRVARAAAEPEKGGKRARERWAQRFYDTISDFGFLPLVEFCPGHLFTISQRSIKDMDLTAHFLFLSLFFETFQMCHIQCVRTSGRIM